MIIRLEEIDDHSKVREVNIQAFPSDDEAILIENLRNSVKVISMVALIGGSVVVHILFSPVTIENGTESFPALAFAPIAVLPEFQNQGIGSKLVEKGIIECRNQEHSIITVLGHPDFYPRFGFKPAGQNGIKSPFEVPEEAFMVNELVDGALCGLNGVIKYSEAFDNIL